MAYASPQLPLCISPQELAHGDQHLKSGQGAATCSAACCGAAARTGSGRACSSWAGFCGSCLGAGTIPGIGSAGWTVQEQCT
eukprot:1160089-Pelagomonas_calceolata.AAC.4